MSSEQTISPATDWQTLYQRFASDARNQTAPTEMVKLLHWPQLDDVPDEHIGIVARMCALLWAKPTAGHLIAPTLHEEPQHTNVLLQTMYAQGYIEFAHDHEVHTPMEEIIPTTKTSGRLSFIDKLRQQLLNQYQTTR